jgi:hypothetical protein
MVGIKHMTLFLFFDSLLIILLSHSTLRPIGHYPLLHEFCIALQLQIQVHNAHYTVHLLIN